MRIDPFNHIQQLSVWAVLALGVGTSTPTSAAVILTFGQTADTPTMSATNNAANTSTEITGTNIDVLISQFAGGGAPLSGFLNFDLVSSAPATLTLGQVFQPFLGGVTFTSAADGLGINYLSVVFTDFVFGTDGGSSLTLSASEPPGTVTYTSDLIDQNMFGLPRAISFAFADVTGPVQIIGSTLLGFTSSVSGTVSANAEPIHIKEPSTAILFGAGVIAIGILRRFSKVAQRHNLVGSFAK